MYGVVSEEMAGEMALGTVRTAQCEISVRISGIAGPFGGPQEKPVGMACFGFCVNGSVCGQIVVGTKAPEVCPVCGFAQSYFEVNAENY